ncbi:hypothetical protein V1294_007126 [Bradyrhizobium sp. AZCC 1678]|jgi:hypothetical protein|uniref:Uncharacterized protein n=2 Tax=Bradyrhizobium TaxID=374 RepID=A0ABU8BI91_9BRAD
MPKIDEAFPADSSIRDAAAQADRSEQVFRRNAKPSWPRSWSAQETGGQEQHGGHMRNIVNEDGEIIAKATKDGTLVGGHHRLIVAGSLSQKLFWQDTGEPVKLDALMHLNSHRRIA